MSTISTSAETNDDTSTTTATAAVTAATTANNDKKISALLGKSVFVNYPQLHEAKIVAVTSEFKEYRCDLNKDTYQPENQRVITYDTMTSNKWRRDSEEEKDKYFKGRGTPGSGGLFIGDILIRLKLVSLQGMATNMLTGDRKKIFGKQEFDVPIQLVLWNHVRDPRFIETSQMPLKALLPPRCQVIGVKGEYLGCLGQVVYDDDLNTDDNGGNANANIANSVLARNTLASEHKNDLNKTANNKTTKRMVNVEFLFPDSDEPQFGHAILKSVREEYYSSRDICKSLKMNPDVLGKMVGSIIIEPGGHDLGLNLKRNGQYQLLGYVRKVDINNGSGGSGGGNVWKQPENVTLVGSSDSSGPLNVINDNVNSFWEYSDKAVALISDYLTKFSSLWYNLSKLPHKVKYSGAELLGSNHAKVVEEIMSWMKSQPFFNMPRTLLTTSSMSK